MLQHPRKSKYPNSRAYSLLFYAFNVVVIILIILALMFAGGFIRFANKTSNMHDSLSNTHISSGEAIVVLTGGTNRLKQAIKLLEKKNDTKLLISGVHPNTTKQQLQKLTNSDKALFDCCVDIDHKALDTVGNATETTAWAKENGFQSLIVVTSNYHMPRSLLLLNRAAPNLTFMPYAIKSTKLNYKNWNSNWHTFNVLFKEYTKYLLTYWNFI